MKIEDQTDYQHCINKLREVLAKFSPTAYDLKEDSEFILELGLSSLQVLSIVEDIETMFDISFPINFFENVVTLKEFALHIIKLSNSSQ